MTIIKYMVDHGKIFPLTFLFWKDSFAFLKENIFDMTSTFYFK